MSIFTMAGLALLAGACGPEQPPRVSVLGLPIINGEPDPSDEHMAVVHLSDGYGMCTGTLITRDVVLTAGHCVDRTSPGAYTVRFSATSYWSPSAIRRGVSERRRHPQYNGDYVLNDIALLRLDEDAPAHIQPIPFLPEHLGITDSDKGESLEFVGFGETETGAVGTKMHAFSEVRWICYGPGYCEFGRGIYGVPKTLCYDQEPGGPCFGDSGGPALFERDGREYVAAVTSYGDPYGCEVYGCSTKVDAFQDFISDFTGGGLGAACTSGDECVFGHCVDGLCCESACDAHCRSCGEPGREGHCVVAANGASCSDGDKCNGEEVCLLGDCVPGIPLECADDNICTNDVCLPALGCVIEPQPEGFACGDCMMCVSGACVEADCGGGGCASAGHAGGGNLGALLLLGLFGVAVRRCR